MRTLPVQRRLVLHSANIARRRGFSLIEMLMVIACLAIMAGVVIPQVSGAVDDAKHGAMLSNLHEVTNAIERYRMDHTGSPPDLLVGRSLPQLSSKTNVDGDIGTGAGYIYGPYLTRMPDNPLNETASVYRITSAPPANLNRRVGWVYHSDSGQIWAGLHVGAAPTGAVESSGALGN